MSYLLNIDTATDICSVALSHNGELMLYREKKGGQQHAALLSAFIQEILAEAGIVANQLNAIAVSGGPGSYTGLRIGVSTAKGLCYGADVPLISISTLKQLANGFITEQKHNFNDMLCPMLDARRMEVYTALYKADLEEIEADKPLIVEDNVYLSYLNKTNVWFFGNGAEKCKAILKHKNARFVKNIHTSAKYMVSLSYQKFIAQEFEDTAYFEPFYLKSFLATTPKKNILV